jgi:glycosyltransferase involved in cell wall biosynthesis
MKILHVIFSFSTGGAETMLVDIMNEQSITQKVDLLVVNNVVNEALIRTINKEVNIHYLNRKPGNRNPIPILQFNYKVFKINPTVVHFHNHNGINLLKYKTKAATCLTIHDVNIPVINFFKYNKLFSISHAVVDDVLMRSGISSILVYNGISFEQIGINSNLLDFEKFKITQISRLDREKKGQHVLMLAINVLVNNKGLKNIQLDLIGEGSSLRYLENLAKELNIEKYVNFLGMKTRKFIYKNLKDYQLLVQPSFFEGFGLTVVEGMAAKIPVLVSDIDGPMEIIDNGRYGFYFKSGDIKECSEKIHDIINGYNTKEIKRKISEAYGYAKENFNIKNTAQNYIDNYES